MSALIRNKTAAFSRLLRLWAVYAGQESSITNESGISINDALINKPLGASEMAQLVNLYSNELMSRKTVLDELQRGGVLDPDLAVDEEIKRIEEEHKEQQAQQHKDNEQKLREDLHRAEEFQKQAPTQLGGLNDKSKEQGLRLNRRKQHRPPRSPVNGGRWQPLFLVFILCAVRDYPMYFARFTFKSDRPLSFLMMVSWLPMPLTIRMRSRLRAGIRDALEGAWFAVR